MMSIPEELEFLVSNLGVGGGVHKDHWRTQWVSRQPVPGQKLDDTLGNRELTDQEHDVAGELRCDGGEASPISGLTEPILTKADGRRCSPLQAACSGSATPCPS